MTPRAGSPRGIRWGLIGIGQHAAQIALAVRAGGDAIAACAGSAPDSARRFAGQHAVPHACGSYEELLRCDDVDAVWIATPNHLHAEMTLAALSAGKHVLCEKPMALSADDAAKMAQQSASSGRLLRVGYHLRFHPVLRQVKSMLAQGRVGVPLEADWQRVSANRPETLQPWRRELSRAGAGVLADVGTHLIDGLRWLLAAEVSSVFALGHPPRRLGMPEDRLTLTLEFDNGTYACIRCSRALRTGANRLEIWGSSGGLETSPLRWTDECWVRHHGPDGEAVHAVATADPYRAEAEAFHREVEGQPTELATGLDGLRAVQVAAAAVRSLESGCAARP